MRTDRRRKESLTKRRAASRRTALVVALAMLLAACADNGEAEPPAEDPEDAAAQEESVDTTENDEDVSDEMNADIISEIFSESDVDLSGESLNVGMLLAMTGQGSFFGDVMSRGALLAAKQIEAAGGPTFNMEIADHESGLVPPAVSGVQRLITQENISALHTSFGAPSEAIIPNIQEAGVLSFNGGGASPGQLNQDFLWMTRMLFAYDPTDGGLAWLAENHPDAKRLALIGTLENGVEAIQEKAPRIWPELQEGGEIVATEIHDVGDTDFSTLIARIRSADPEAIFTVSFGDDLGHQVRQFREAGVDVPIMGIEYTEQACEIAGETYDGFLFATDFYDVNNENPWNQAFVQAHEAEYGEPPEYYGANYYEMNFILWQLMQRVADAGGDPTSGYELQDELLANPAFNSVYGGTPDEVGQMEFDSEDHTISKPMGVFDVQDCTPNRLAEIVKVGEEDDPASALVANS